MLIIRAADFLCRNPLELEILAHLPPGLEANLEYLAIRDADYGAVTDTWIEPCHNDPSMVTIGCMKRIDERKRGAGRALLPMTFKDC